LVGIIQKENPKGKLVKEWNDALSLNNVTLQTVDVTAGLAITLAPKLPDELV
jgi:nucleosome binding factor SPN SPT16 subunit